MSPWPPSAARQSPPPRTVTRLGPASTPSHRKSQCPSEGAAPIRLAGGSPATVVTKQPCSWWPARGEIQSVEAPRQRPFGGRASMRSVTSSESCSVVILPAGFAGSGGSRALVLRAKATDRVKSLESQPQGTLRRRGIGTFAQPNTERERSVFAPASGGRRFASLRCPVRGEADKCSSRNGQARSGSQRRW